MVSKWVNDNPEYHPSVHTQLIGYQTCHIINPYPPFRIFAPYPSCHIIPKQIIIMPSHNKSDANLEGWFVNHSLPWNDNIVKFHLNQGVELVEHIKVLKKGLFLEHFVGEKPIVQAMAKIALKELGGSDTFSLSRSST